VATGGARYTTVSSEKWEDEWYLGLTPQQRNLFDFLVEGSHGTYAGVFRLDSGTPRQKTGPWRAGTWEGALDAMQGHVIRYPGNWWFVVNYLRWNGPRPGTKLAPNQAFGIAEIVMAAPEECRRHFVSRYRPLLKGFSTPLDSVQDPLSIPGHTIPGHTIPTHTKTSFAAKLPAATCPWCRWREGHPGDAIPEGPRFRVQRIHDLHRAHFGECLVVTAKEQGLLKRAVARYTEQRVLRWWGEFIRQESKIGHSLAVFCSNAVLTRLAEADPETKATAMKAREAEMLAETARMRGNK
jgi:hypothetical protein